MLLRKVSEFMRKFQKLACCVSEESGFMRITSLVVSVRKVNLCEVLNQLACCVSEESEFMGSFESTHLLCQ